MSAENFKFRDIKTYCSTEWLANNTKKYRSVFDEQEIAYLYCEVSLFNKRFDDKPWKLQMQLKCLDEQNNEICDLNCDREVDTADSIIYIREGWGVKTPGAYWKAGIYRWEAWINGELAATKTFYVENVGMVRSGMNPYFKIETVKLYEGPDENTRSEDRKYYTVFNAMSTRYVWVEVNTKNLTRKSQDLPVELIFNFRTANGYLKGSVTKLFFIKPNDETFTATIGWGSDIVGTWSRGEYYAEIIFMDELLASMPFEIGDDYVEATEEDFLPLTQIEFVHLEDDDENDNTDNHQGRVEKEESGEAQNFDEVMKELDQLIGLGSIKQKIHEYSDYLRFVALRREKGFEESDKINLHAVFKGNPGTGKTTVARLLGKIYKELGLLKKGHVHEVDRGDLVAEFIGQTAPKTKEAIKKAKDGILFIDEAYSLARKDEDSKDFGREAIEVLLKELSDSNDIAIVVAGYPEEMEIFLESNPGLKSRFNMYYDFADYVPQELLQIAEFSAGKKGVRFTEAAKDVLYKYLVDKYRDRDKFFGNARMVNSIVDEAKMNLGLRIMKTAKPADLTKEQLSDIEPVDLQKIMTTGKGMLPDIPIDEELLKESLGKLKRMIGLNKVKQDIDELVKLVRYYKSQGKDVRKAFSLHNVFSGNPGTGKTTVARILAQIYKALGILERGHLVECDRQSLVGGYVGQTAIKTSDLINKAIGGVLFVDEAYSLTDGGPNDFGREAVETLLKRMEDRRGEFIVIAAGYTQNMEKFMESNPGLKSRFDKVFNFEDFNADELYTVAVNQLAENNITPDAAAADHLRKYIEFMYRNRDKYFGNGRSVRKVIEEAIRNQHLRLSELPKNKQTAKAITTLVFEDVEEFSTDIKPGTPGGGIGFR
ncbi:MAG: AAA family ATPase [Sphingomonadales bacterium]|jgi:SpoVK/Ycf46/Vps4 family AAA+-type ATPase